MSLLDLGLLCLRLGFLSFGGGQVTLAEMQRTLVIDRGAMTAEQFAHGFALGQATPGPGILYLVPIGMTIAGPAGAIVAVTAFVLPSLTLAAVLVHLLDRFGESPWVVAVNRTLAPMSIGLMAAGLRTVAVPLVGDPWAVIGVLIAALILIRSRINQSLVVVGAGLLWLLGSA